MAKVSEYDRIFQEAYIAARMYWRGDDVSDDDAVPQNPYIKRRNRLAWDAGWKYGTEC
jgi:hypothetical protein